MRTLLALGAAIVIALVPRAAHPCDCAEYPEFWNAVRQAPVVVVARIGRQVVNAEKRVVGFEVVVEQVVKGQERRRTVELVDRQPSMCSLYYGDYPIGGRYAIALKPGDPAEGDFGCSDRIRPIGSGKEARAVTLAELTERLRTP